MSSGVIRVQIGMRGGQVVEQIVDARIDEPPAPVSTVGSGFRNSSFVEFS